jgi:hypothetical protein
MVLGGLQAFSLVSILLLILPGWLGVKLYLRGVKRQDRLNRLDTVVVSICVSLGVLSVLALCYVVLLAALVIITPGSGSWLPALERLSPLVSLSWLGIGNYILVVSTAAAVGKYCAREGYFMRQLPDPPNSVWRRQLESIENSPGDDHIRVVTADDDHISGKLGGWSVDSKDLVVEEPERIEADTGEHGQSSEPLDSRMYLHHSEIARVYVGQPNTADESSVSPDRPEPEADRELGELDKTASESSGSDE